MLYFPAQYFDGKTSTQEDVLVGVDNERVWHVLDPDGNKKSSLPTDIAFERLSIQRQIGQAPRIIHLPNSAQIVTTEHRAVDSALNAQSKRRFAVTRTLQILEQNFSALAALLFITVGFCLFCYFIALPKAAETIVDLIPSSLTKKLDKQGMRIADAEFLKPTQLSPDKQYELQKHFTNIIDGQSLDLNIKFRSAPKVGANAFALPNGTIVLTDELINLTDDYDELEAILAHEIGHVHYKHTLKQMVHQNAISFLLTLGGITSDITSIGGSLLNLSHSREHETEADSFAILYADKAYFEPIDFATMLTKMMNSHDMGCLIVEYEVTCDVDEEASLTRYLSSHPVSETRIQRFLDLQKEWDNKTKP